MAKWNDTIKSCEVMVMIHQVLLNALNWGCIKLTDVCLLILDECHHAVKNSPYSQIFRHHYVPLKQEMPQKLPHILALSASIVPSKCNEVSFPEKKKELELSLDSKVITTDGIKDLLLYVTNPIESMVLYKPDTACPALVSTLESKSIEQLESVRKNYFSNESFYDELSFGNAKNEIDSKIKKFKKYVTGFGEVLRVLGLYCGNFLIDESKSSLSDDKVRCKQPYEVEMVRVVESFHGEISDMMDIKMDMEDCNSLLDFTTPKVQKLLDILKNPFELQTNKRHQLRDQVVAIIFVKQRIVATSLAPLIRKYASQYPQKYGHLRVGFAVGGQSSEAFKNPGARKIEEWDEERKKLEATLNEFRRGDLNCIVATEVLEEGLDVHNCNLIIRFDGLPNFRAYVQSKGRARARETCGQRSRFVIMGEEGSEDTIKLRSDWKGYQRLESSSIEICHAASEHAYEDNQIIDSDDDIYYLDPSNPLSSPRITINSAISVVYGYTQNIPTDRYTKLMPYFETSILSNAEANDSLDCEYTGVLHMPHKTIYSGQPFQGPPSVCRKKAKQRVALLACKALHRDGFLGDDLRPKKRKRGLLDEELCDDEKEYGKRGTKSRKEYYPVSLANELRLDQHDEQCFLYKINHETDKDNREEDNGVSTIGFLVSQQLPEICDSPINLYSPYGTHGLTLELCDIIPTSELQLEQLLNFQDYAFDKIVGCKRSWMWIGHENDGLLLAPIGQHDKIDVEMLRYVADRNNKSYSARGNSQHLAFEYENKVVSPIHKEHLEHYFVEESIKGSNPQTKIDDAGNETYASYYSTKYGFTIHNQNQELLRVSGADHRYHHFSKITLKRNKIRSPKKDQMFLPELVSIEPVPASLWRKIQMVPFFLSRLTSFIR